MYVSQDHSLWYFTVHIVSIMPSNTTVVKTAKTRATSHSVIGAIHSSAVLHVVLKKPPPKPELDTVAKKK